MGGKRKYRSGSEVVEKSFLKDLSKEDLETKIREEAYLGLLTNDETLFNPLLDIPMVAHDNFNEYLVYLMSQPDYFYFIIKILFGMETFPMQMVLLKEMFTHRFPIVIASRGASKTFSLGLYVLIRMIITPGVKIVVTGAGFRQAKLVFEVMENIWNKAPMFRNCFKGARNGPFHGTDAWTFRLGESICYALPVGHDGSKVRGFRAHILLNDEFGCTRKSIVATDLGLLKIEDIVNNKISCNVYNSNGELEPVIAYNKTPLTDVYTLTTKYNYEIDFSDKHQFMLEDGSWKLGKDLTKDDFIIFDHKYKFTNRVFPDYNGISGEKMCRLFGLLISEGDLSNKYHVTVSNTDEDLIDSLVDDFKILNPKVYIRDAYTDKRGWNCKKIYNFQIQSVIFRKYLESVGLDYNICYDKKIPMELLKYDRKFILSFLNGLFIGDGSAFNFNEKSKKDKSEKTRFGIAYYSVSKDLIDDLHILLKYMGYISYKNKRKSKLSDKDQWFIRLNGKYAENFAREIQYPNVEQLIENVSPYLDRFNDKIGTIVKRGKRFKAQVFYNNKQIYIGTFDSNDEAELKIKEFEDNKKMCVRVKSVGKLDEQDHLYDIALPLTHSYYANGMVNHNTMPRTIFEEVMSGFLSVSADSIGQIKQRAHISAKKMMGLKLYHTDIDSGIVQNQLILSGTAYYKHNHFYEYFKKWKSIIESHGNLDLIREYFKDEDDMSFFNWKDYSIFRVPVELIQAGHMDMAQISRIKTSVNKDVFLREYSACFSDDSDGFFKRSLINHCTASSNNPIIKDGEHIKFSPSIFGRKQKKHVYGIDPAYQGDNFAIVILEINDSHRRIVHCWTTQASDHKQRLKDGIITENNYYQYCVRKIRDLMVRFPCAYIALDKGGGGTAILESFMDTNLLKPGEVAILPVIDPLEKPQDTDFMEGEHILHIIKPTAEWNTEANHSLKRDMETRDIIFPLHDEISYVEAEFYDPIFVPQLGESSVLYDTLEDCMSEIEELKNELSTITISETSTGKEHFDTPEKKTAGMKKGRLKKDRYSALLMANMIARNAENLIVRPLNTMENAMEAYFGNKENTTLFLGNGPIASKLNDLYS